MIYRRPTPHEAEAMAALHVQCWREAYAEILPAELMATFSDETRRPMWRKALADDERIAFAAFDRNQPVGFILAGNPVEALSENEDGQIGAIYITASHYRRGIGRKLIELAVAEWIERGGRSLTLGVLAENVRARSFYESLGAKLVRTSTFVWDGYSLPDAIYVFDDLASLTP
jgi:ribosomal protein S18 acetylase RimI-like enzyme